MIVVDKAALDPIEEGLEWDLKMARDRTQRLRRQLAKSERAESLRLRELAEYRVNQIVPKRKKVRRRIDDALVRAAKASGRVLQKRGLS